MTSVYSADEGECKTRPEQGVNKGEKARYKQKGYINKEFLVFMIPALASIRHNKCITPNEIFTNKFHSKLY